jgi:Na+:H+ antiporter, NhaA family
MSGTGLTHLLKPFQRFFQLEASSGILLIIFTLLALAWINSPWGETYNTFWHHDLTIQFGEASLSKSLLHWVNDGLMVLFFFVVGLEIKRELLVGELSSLKQAVLPVVAALGGFVLPAVFYLLFNTPGTISGQGWAIPAATDIAFALGILALLGNRVPLGLKVFLTALAIVDDLFAILIVALFYTSDLSMVSLAAGGIITLVLMVINFSGIRHPLPYAILGVFLWFAFLKSGVHATIAGVILAMTIPAKSNASVKELVKQGQNILSDLGKSNVDTPSNLMANRAYLSKVHQLEHVVENVQTPLHKLEHFLHPWAIFFVMPVFALANAGVALSWDSFVESMQSPVSLGVVIGLLFGKQIGIMISSWLVVRLGLAYLPKDVKWVHMSGVACLAGIGFTMSLFIGLLSFGGTVYFDHAKIGIFMASLLAGVIGWLVLNKTLKPARQPGENVVSLEPLLKQ